MRSTSTFITKNWKTLRNLAINNTSSCNGSYSGVLGARKKVDLYITVLLIEEAI